MIALFMLLVSSDLALEDPFCILKAFRYQMENTGVLTYQVSNYPDFFWGTSVESIFESWNRVEQREEYTVLAWFSGRCVSDKTPTTQAVRQHAYSAVEESESLATSLICWTPFCIRA
jgi:hypothetical protein